MQQARSDRTGAGSRTGERGRARRVDWRLWGWRRQVSFTLGPALGLAKCARPRSLFQPTAQRIPARRARPRSAPVKSSRRGTRSGGSGTTGLPLVCGMPGLVLVSDLARPDSLPRVFPVGLEGAPVRREGQESRALTSKNKDDV